MITRIREVRKAKGLTLEEVAARCAPPTTAQTVGRLETGTRTVSVGWLNRIAEAIGVDAADLVEGSGTTEVEVAAVLSSSGKANAPNRRAFIVPPRPSPGIIGVTVATSVGDYRAGDEIWCAPLAPDEFVRALNRDVLVPRPAGRFLFGRLIGREGKRLQLLPLGTGARQQIVTDPTWIAMATKLVRTL